VRARGFGVLLTVRLKGRTTVGGKGYREAGGVGYLLSIWVSGHYFSGLFSLGIFSIWGTLSLYSPGSYFFWVWTPLAL